MAVYESASVTDLQRRVIIYFLENAFTIARAAHESIIESLQCEHKKQRNILRFCYDDPKRTIMPQSAFWILVNGHIKTEGPLLPVNIFRKELQVFYYKTKGGVVGLMQCRSIMRESTTKLGLEQKVVTQTQNTILINGVIALRLIATHRTYNNYEFKYLHPYRTKLNFLESFQITSGLQAKR